MYPSYTYPKYIGWSLAASVFFGRRRSFRRDGQACIQRLRPPLRVLGQENIPRGGPCLITFNHYYRRGFDAWWMALAIAATVPVDMHFVMTGELTFPGKWYAPFGMVGSRWLLKRIGKAYGFSTMPPMPPRSRDVEARAGSVRAVLSYVRSHPQTVLGLAPEGGDQPGGVLNWPAQGAGRFIALLTGSGMPVIPVGVYEEDGFLCLNFGRVHLLSIPRDLPPAEKDREVVKVVMDAIAALLPLRLRGRFQQVDPGLGP